MSQVSVEYRGRENTMPMVPFVVTFSKQLSFLNSALKTNFQEAQNKIPALGEFKMITAYRRSVHN